MQFTYRSYASMIENLLNRGYQIRNYKNWDDTAKTVILRHDVDYNLKKAVALSEVEKKVCNGGGIYFVLVSTDFYNIHSKESRKAINTILENGGSIGLHFDETQYSIFSEEELKKYVCKEAEILSDIVGTRIEAVSMHRPSANMLDADIRFANIINSYSHIYIKEMKYLSDSRRHWRENVDEIIEQGSFTRLHILTHPFWYSQGVESKLKQTLKEAILNASLEYYDNLNDNFRSLQEEIRRSEIERMIYQ